MFHRLTQVILSTSKSRRATSLVSAGKIISVTLVAIWFAYPLTLIISACRWWPSGSLFIAALLDSAGSIAWLERRLHRNGLHSIDILTRKFKQEDALRSFVRANVEPRFHSTESLPATSLIDANFEAISAELLDYVDRGRSGFRNAYDNAWMPTGEYWKAINLLGWGLHNSTDLPVTRGILREVKAINCNISRLAPGSEIHRHCAESNAYIRCHLPLRVPGELPEVGLEVGGEGRLLESG